MCNNLDWALGSRSSFYIVDPCVLAVLFDQLPNYFPLLLWPVFVNYCSSVQQQQ